MFRRLIVLFALFFLASAVTIAPPKPTCKVVSDCPKFGHDQFQCIKGECVTIQHEVKHHH